MRPQDFIGDVHRATAENGRKRTAANLKNHTCNRVVRWLPAGLAPFGSSQSDMVAKLAGSWRCNATTANHSPTPDGAGNKRAY